jgi:hypothetical protein
MKRICAIDADALAIPPKPNAAATRAKTRKISAQYNMFDSFRFYAVLARVAGRRAVLPMRVGLDAVAPPRLLRAEKAWATISTALTARYALAADINALSIAPLL